MTDNSIAIYASSDLVEWMAIDDGEDGNAAFAELILRFREPLLKYCEWKCRVDGNNLEDTPEIVMNAFWRARRYHSYDPAKSKTTDKQEVGVKFWLLGILRREYLSYYTADPISDDTEEYEIIYEVTDSDIECGDTRKFVTKSKILLDAINSLDAKEKAVFLTYAEYRTEDHKCIPRKLRQKLSEELGLEASSLRVYNKRAKERIQKHLKDHGHER